MPKNPFEQLSRQQAKIKAIEFSVEAEKEKFSETDVREIRDSFKAGDYDRVIAWVLGENLGKWPEELRGLVEDHYLYCLERGAFDDILKLQRETGVELDPHKASVKEAAKKAIETCIEGGYLDDIKTIEDLTGLKYTWTKAKALEIVEKILDSRTYYYIFARRPSTLAQTEEDYWQEDDEYADEDAAVEPEVPYVLQQLEKFESLTGLDLRADIRKMGRAVRKYYLDRLGAGRDDEAKAVETALGVPMDFSGDAAKEEVNDFFIDLLENGRLMPGSPIERLADPKLGLKPDWQGKLRPYVEQAYQKMCVEVPYELKSQIELLSNISGIQPDWQGKLRSVVEDKYVKLISEGYMDDLEHLIKASGIEPDWQGKLRSVVQDKYAQLISGNRMSDLEHLIKASGIELDRQGKLWSLVQDKYAKLISGGYDIQRLEPLIKASGIEPDWQDKLRNVVEDRYAKHISEGDIQRLEPLIKVSGIEPDWQGKLRSVVEDRYVKLISEGYIQRLESLIRASGIEPDWQGKLRSVVEDRYAKLISWGYISDLESLIKVSGIEPDWQDKLRNVVEDRYADIISRGDIKGLEPLIKVSGIEPDWQGKLRSVVEDRYARLISWGDIKGLESLIKASGIEPDWQGKLRSVVEDRYADIISRGDIKGLEPLIKASGIEPDWQGKLRVNVGVRMLEDIIDLRGKSDYWEKASGMKFEELSVEQAVWDTFIQNHDFNSIEWISGKLKAESPELAERALEARNKALAALSTSKLRDGDYHASYDILEKFQIKPMDAAVHLVQAGLKCLENGELPEALLALFQACRVRFELTPEQLATLPIGDPRLAAIVNTICVPRDKAKREEFRAVLDARGGYLPVIPELLKIKPPAPKQEVCPWFNHLNPLIESLERERPFTGDSWLSQDNARRRGLLEFVQRFGMVNLPLLARTVVDLVELRESAVGQPKDKPHVLPPETELCLRAFARSHGFSWGGEGGIKPDQVNRVLEDLRITAENLKRAVLADRLPEALEGSALDMELFNSIVFRGSSYGSFEDRDQLIATWRSRVNSGQKTGVPEFFPSRRERQTYVVRRLSSGASFQELVARLDQSAEDPEALKARQEASDKLKEEIEKTHAKEPFTAFLAPFMQALDEFKDYGPGAQPPEVLFAPLAASHRALLNKLDEQIAQTEAGSKKRQGLEAKRQKIADNLNRLQTTFFEEDGINRVLRAEIERLQALPESKQTKQDAERLRKLMESSSVEGHGALPTNRLYLDCQKKFEALRLTFGKDVLAVAGREARQLMLSMLSLESFGHIDAIQQVQAGAQGRMTTEVREAWAKLFEEEVLLHFANPEGVHREIRSVDFTTGAMQLVESLWRINGIRQGLVGAKDKDKNRPKHPFYDVVLQARTLERRLKRLENPEAAHESEEVETAEVSFHDCHGLGRIFAGDVGNACFDKLRGQLAKNEYPNLDAVLMAQEDAETKITRLLGSFLLIRGKDEEDKSYIAIRALNPTESVVNNELKPEDILDAAIEHATRIAKAGNIDQVLVCVDSHRGGHGSNREAMFAAMRAAVESRTWALAPRLKNTPETNFNGYEIWRGGEKEVYVAWKKAENA